jgi:hypothetical protein
MVAVPKLFRLILAMVTAFAVIIVGTTCTSSGCLLPLLLAGQTTVSCCCECAPPKPHDHSDHKAPGHCPTCNQKLISRPDSSDQFANSSIDLAPNFLLAVSDLVASLTQQSAGRSFRFAFDTPPPLQSSTLHALSCSFLN